MLPLVVVFPYWHTHTQKDKNRKEDWPQKSRRGRKEDVVKPRERLWGLKREEARGRTGHWGKSVGRSEVCGDESEMGRGKNGMAEEC